ncbi:MAG: DUF4249 domain-containing protein [Cytophagales bacterium]|nr:MAG: DUF4249 domain-containing protein [Cytophagales bacterium]
MNRIFLLFLLLPVFLSSCETGLRNEVDPDRLNREASKLVVACFISPQDTVLAARIGLSTPVLGSVTATNSFLNVTNANVTITNGSRLAALRYGNYNGLGVYVVSARDFPVLEGQTYTLNVETPDGKKVTSQCTIPGPPPTPEARFDSTVQESGFSFSNGVRTPFITKEYGLRLQWTDPAGQRNYYRAAGFFRYQPITLTNPALVQPPTVSTTFFDNNGLQADAASTDGTRLVSRRGIYHRYNNNGGFFSNPIVITNPDNTTTTIFCPTCTTSITGPSGTTNISPPPGSISNPASQTIDIGKVTLSSIVRQAELTYSLLHVDENYYRYQDAIWRQGGSDGNPFAEPVPIPTNINGGLGCFGGYNRRSVVLKIK